VLKSRAKAKTKTKTKTRTKTATKRSKRKIIELNPIQRCPLCKNRNQKMITKHGHNQAGVQRYKCHKCNKTFPAGKK
jgi:hypothetical protein